MDYSFFLAINSLVGRWQWLDVIGKFFGGDYFLYLFALFVVLLWFNKKFRTYGYYALSSVLISRGLIAEILKRAFHRPRPFDGEALSFPSGHATVYFAFAFAFY